MGYVILQDLTLLTLDPVNSIWRCASLQDLTPNVQGRILSAILFFAIVGIGYFFAVLIIPAVIGGIFHLWSIIDAARFVGTD